MEKVRSSDATWLYMDNESMPLHVASLPLFQLPEGREETFFDEFYEAMQRNVARVKAYRLRRKKTPMFLDHPVWVDDANIDLDAHVKRVKLPAPGSMEQLENAAARSMARPMDLDKPLWEYTLFEGLEGNRIALLLKMHHSIVDGESGVKIISSVLSTDPTDLTHTQPIPEIEVEEEPTDIDLVGQAARDLMRQPWDLLSLAPRLAQTAWGTARLALETIAERRSVRFTAPSTLFNRAISKHRIYSALSLPLDEFKAIKNATGATLNDVVMSVCAGALRSYLIDHDNLPPRYSLIAMVPVSLRREGKGDSDHIGSQVTGMPCPIGTQFEDPLERLVYVHEEAVKAKENVEVTGDALIQNFSVAGAPLALQLASQAYAGLRLANYHQPLVNLVISNVAGPRQTLYLEGAEMLTYYPVSTLAHGQGLNITVQSYRNSLDFGLMADRKLMGDLPKLRDHMIASFQELKAAAEKLPTSSGSGGKAKKPAKAKTKSGARKTIRPSNSNAGPLQMAAE